MSEIVKPTTLTKEQIEKAREELLIDFDFTGTICDDINALCDMAIACLTMRTKEIPAAIQKALDEHYAGLRAEELTEEQGGFS